MQGKKIIVQNAAIPKMTGSDSSSKRGLEEALKYVCTNWFPVNSTVFQQIQTRLKSGHYTENPGSFIEDVKSDLSIYAYCLSKLKEVANEDNILRSPVEILEGITLEQLAGFFNITEEQMSLHKFNPEMKVQAVSMRHALISSSTAEALAEKARLDANMAFMCASVRHVGLNLLSWNYPRIFGKALSAVGQEEGVDLEAELTRIMGFSPLVLGYRAVLDWNKCPDVLMATGVIGERADGHNGQAEADVGHEDNSLGGRIKKFCEIGEAMARISDPEHFPLASKDWDNVVGEINHYLGPSGMSIITEKVEKNSASYQSVAPAFFKIDVSPERCQKVANSHYTSKLYEENTYIRKCPEKTQQAFKKVYASIINGSPSPKAIGTLVGEVIPQLGFTRGCVYLVDPERLVVVPKLRIGDSPLTRYRALACSDTGPFCHPVILALSYSTPIIQEGAAVNGDKVSHVTGVFGNREQMGVLYVEMSDDLVRDPDRTRPLLYFKAIRQSVNDCLGLREY